MPPSTAPNQSIYPGTTGVLLGTTTLYGSPITAGPEAIAPGASSRTVVVAARPGGIANTQRQIVWSVQYSGGTASGTPAWQLFGSPDGVNFAIIDSSAETSNFIRNVEADAATNDLASAKIVSSCRFFYLKNNGASTETVQAQITCE